MPCVLAEDSASGHPDCLYYLLFIMVEGRGGCLVRGIAARLWRSMLVMGELGPSSPIKVWAQD